MLRKAGLFNLLFFGATVLSFTQSLHMGGQPQYFYSENIVACGPYHFLIDRSFLYRSNTDHTQWIEIPVNLGNQQLWGIHNSNDTLFITGSSRHIYRSVDYGQSFTIAGANLGPVEPVEFFQKNDSIIYVGGNNRISVSYDGGDSFRDAVTAAKAGPAAYYENNGVYLEKSSPNPTMVLSNDHFRTYTISTAMEIHTGKPSCMEVLGSTFFVGTQGSPFIYRSFDFGASWDSIFTDSAIVRIYDFYQDETGLWAGTNIGLLKSNPDGSAWTHQPYDDMDGWPMGGPNTIHISGHKDTLYATLYHSVILRSLDHGETWKEHQRGIHKGTTLQLYSDGVHLSAGTNEGQFYSPDLNDVWTVRRSKILEDEQLFPWTYWNWHIKGNSQFLYSLDGLHQSLDSGESWSTVTSLKIGPFMEYKDTLWTAYNRIVLYSPNAGHNWLVFGNYPQITSKITGMCRYKNFLSLMTNSISDDLNIFSVKDGGSPQIKFGTDKTAGLPDKIAGGKDSIMVADGGRNKIFLSKDAGLSWTEELIPIAHGTVYDVDYADGIVLAATQFGLWAFSIHDSAWIEVDPPLFGNRVIWDIADHKGEFYISVEERGIYRIDFKRLACQFNPSGPGCGVIEGKVFVSANSECPFDSNSLALPGQLIEIFPGPDYAISQLDGEFSFHLEEGDYIITPVHPTGYYLNLVCPDSGYYIVTLDSNQVFADSLYFTWDLVPGVEDLSIKIVSIGPVRSNDYTQFKVICENPGTTVQHAEVVLNFSNKISYSTSSLTPLSSSNSHVTWDIGNLLPFEGTIIDASFYVRPNNEIGDTVQLIGRILPVEGDTTPLNNVDSVILTIRGSFDPNDKLVEPAGIGPLGIIPTTTTKFTYTIRFQNTGNDTSFAVSIIDTLDQIFDLSTFKILSSEPTNVVVTMDQGILLFQFPGIQLPDSIADFIGSQGYVQFEITASGPLEEGQQIKNRAHIIFDTNTPVATNVALNTVEIIQANEKAIFTKSNLEVYPVPSTGHVFIRMNGLPVGGDFLVYTPDGKPVDVLKKNLHDGLQEISLPPSARTQIYFIIYSVHSEPVASARIIVSQ